MSIGSSIAIYLLFWVMSAFIVMPFGMRAANEGEEPLIPGQSESAPANFRPGRIIVLTTIVATIAFALYYANYVNGWITADMLDLTR